MSDLKQFERMVETARGECPPRIDVAARVVATIESYKHPLVAFCKPLSAFFE
jgi:hypothetical protein